MNPFPQPTSSTRMPGLVSPARAITIGINREYSAIPVQSGNHSPCKCLNSSRFLLRKNSFIYAVQRQTHGAKGESLRGKPVCIGAQSHPQLRVA